METMEAILGRRSVRKFRQERLSVRDLTTIVKAGAWAASAGNGQPWKFVLVIEPEKVNAITASLAWLPAAGKPAEGERPTAHVVVLIPQDASWAIQADAAAAIQNMLIAATDKGIGSCWFGSVQRTQVGKLLGIPEEWHIYSVVALGYPGETPAAVKGDDTAVTKDDSGRLVVPKRPLETVMSVDGFS